MYCPRLGVLRGSVVALVIVVACGFDSSGVGSDGTATDFTSDPTTSSTSATTTLTTASSVDTSASDPSAPSTTVDPTTDDPTTGDATSDATQTDPSQGESSSAESGEVEGWWNPAWAKRRRVALELPSTVADPLEGVPILLLLDSSRITYAELLTRGQDLRFVDSDDETPLHYEIESWDPQGTSAVWVLVPELGENDSIYMYWGNPEADAGTDPHGVWASGYAGVYHLDNDPMNRAPQILDSSPSDRHATAQGGMMSNDLVAGLTTPALEFDGTDDVALIGPIATDAWTELTVSAWMLHANTEDERAVSKAFGTGPNDHVFFLGAHGSDVKLRVRTDGAGAGTIEMRPQGSLPAGTWAYVAMVWTAASGEVVLYVDGVEIDAAPLDGDTLADGAHDVLIGNAVAGQDRYWNGTLDEVRIEHAARSSEWFVVQQASMNDDIATFGNEESVP